MPATLKLMHPTGKCCAVFAWVWSGTGCEWWHGDVSGILPVRGHCGRRGLGVVFARNPVHAVLWLILAFLASAGLFVLQGAEFVAMLLVIVYVGAVAVLFLFVVMMLDVDFATSAPGWQSGFLRAS